MTNRLNPRKAAFQGERRLAMVGVTSALFFQLITKGWKSDGSVECIEGLPEGAVNVGQFYNPERQVLYLIFFHPSFELVPLGDSPPMIEVKFQMLRAS